MSLKKFQKTTAKGKKPLEIHFEYKQKGTKTKKSSLKIQLKLKGSIHKQRETTLNHVTDEHPAEWYESLSATSF